MTSPALAPPVSELPPAIPLEEADDRLSRIVNNLLDCHTGPVTVLRGGRPVAFITPAPRFPPPPRHPLRFGLGKGKYDIPDDIDASNDEILELFGLNHDE